MEKHIEGTPATKRARFSVLLNLSQLDELLRRMKLGDGRSLGDWVEYGLHLALRDTTRESKPAVSEPMPEKRPPGNPEIARAFQALEALNAEEDLRLERLGVKPRPGSYRGA